MKINEHDIIVLTENVDNIKKGKKGTVIYIYKDKKTFEVEFEGETKTLKLNQIKKVEIKKITRGEFEKAYEIVAMYQAQNKDTIQVSVEFEASLNITFNVPANWSVEEIIKEFKSGYDFSHDIEEEKEPKINKIKSLIVNGYEINLETKKPKIIEK